MPRSRPDEATEGGASQGFDVVSDAHNSAAGAASTSETLSCGCCLPLLMFGAPAPAFELPLAGARAAFALTASGFETMAARLAARLERARSAGTIADAGASTVTAPVDVNEVAPPREACSVCMPLPPCSGTVAAAAGAAAHECAPLARFRLASSPCSSARSPALKSSSSWKPTRSSEWPAALRARPGAEMLKLRRPEACAPSSPLPASSPASAAAISSSSRSA